MSLLVEYNNQKAVITPNRDKNASITVELPDEGAAVGRPLKKAIDIIHGTIAEEYYAKTSGFSNDLTVQGKHSVICLKKLLAMIKNDEEVKIENIKRSDL